jgi:ornithine--oxo-acid transaminase
VVAMLQTGEFQERARVLGERLAAGLGELVGSGVDEVRTRGLWAGVDMSPELATGRQVCEQLLDQGILAKEAHGQTVRLAPPLVASEDDIDLLVDAFGKVCSA